MRPVNARASQRDDLTQIADWIRLGFDLQTCHDSSREACRIGLAANAP
jgi:hypothetical protein